MKKFLLLCVAISCCFARNTIAKPDRALMKANYYYRQLAFYEAIPYYEKIADTSDDPLLLAHLANCYKLTGNPQLAAFWYAKAVPGEDCPPEVKLHYGQALMTLGDYEKAARWLKEYQASAPQEQRVANLIKGCNLAPQMLAEVPEGYVSLLAFNTDASEFGPALNHRTLVFATDSVRDLPDGSDRKQHSKTDQWTGNAFYNLYSVPCDLNGNCGRELTRVAADINTRYHDGPASFSADGKTMYFTRTTFQDKFLNRGPLPDLNGTVHLQIMIASGNDINGNFEKIKPFKYNSRKYSTAHPTVSPDGTMMVFVSDMPGGKGGNDLYICRKDEEGNWGTPRNMSILNTEGDEMFPVFWDNHTLGFSSNGLVGLGGLDIYKTIWSPAAESFSKPENMGTPVNSSYDDMSLTLTTKGTTGYLASNRPASRKGDNIFFVNLENIYLALRVTDDVTGLPVKAASVTIDGLEKSLISDGQGTVFSPLRPQHSYTVTAEKAGYQTKSVQVSTFNIRNTDTLVYEIKLKPEFNINYQVVVLDRLSERPVEGVRLVIAKLGGTDSDTTLLDPDQVFSTPLDPDAEYSIYALKDNYFSNEKFVSTKGISKTLGNVTIKDTIYMKELKIGEVYKIEDIYYDFDKANIREDAKKSLNSLINLLNQYPEMTIQINSYTDCRGSDQYNLRLSDARAHSVIRYLGERGISRSRLKYKGFGETHPAVDCQCADCTEAEHQENRRTEFQIISM